MRYSYRTFTYDLGRPSPASPSWDNLLGTDDQARDVLARLIYGFRISVLFGLCLAFCSSVVGIAAGTVQGYFGGWVDLIFQRFIEIWSGLPTLFLLIILASIVEPSFSYLLGFMLLFSWMSLVGVVRAEVLRARNLDFVPKRGRNHAPAVDDIGAIVLLNILNSHQKFVARLHQIIGHLPVRYGRQAGQIGRACREKS